MMITRHRKNNKIRLHSITGSHSGLRRQLVYRIYLAKPSKYLAGPLMEQKIRPDAPSCSLQSSCATKLQPTSIGFLYNTPAIGPPVFRPSNRDADSIGTLYCFGVFSAISQLRRYVSCSSNGEFRSQYCSSITQAAPWSSI